jgi:glycosyltransferase involved in cell wall biosynthesis
MREPDIRLSVALVTRNRPESVQRCLESLRAQSVQPFEVLVSDDSDDASIGATRQIATQYDCRYITGPRRGLYANRNHVALACRGTHIRTMDDDHEFPKHHFEQVLSCIQKQPDSIWIIGEFLPHERIFFPPCCPGEIQPRGFSAPPTNPDNTFAISDGATIYPMEVFDTHAYLEVFKFGSAYLEFGARLKAVGWRIRFMSGTYIIHHYNPLGRSFHDSRMEQQSSFLASLLTYSTYLPCSFSMLETLCYFGIVALAHSIKLDSAAFRLTDYVAVLRMALMYRQLFRNRRFDDIR